MRELLDLFLTFAKLGSLTFGGGLSMLPILNHEIVEKRNWSTEEEIIDFYAVGQCTPGIIAVNTATFIGYKRKGILGGIVATLGMIAPSVIIILIVASILRTFIDRVYVQAALSGIRAAVCALMLNTILVLFRKNVNGWTSFFLCASAFVATFFFDVSSIVVVIVGGTIGWLINRRKKEEAV